MEISNLQFALGFLTLVCALLVVLGRNPVVSAMALMGTLFSTGLLYFSLEAFFIGAVQILIYAGAISVLFVFIVMLLDLKPLKIQIPGRGPVLVLACGIGVLLFLSTIVAVLPALNVAGLGSTFDAVAPADSLLPTSAAAISLTFLSKYMIPFQATVLLLLAAVMGVVIFAKSTRQNAGVPDSQSEGSQK